jgi:hypothetical protein
MTTITLAVSGALSPTAATKPVANSASTVAGDAQDVADRLVQPVNCTACRLKDRHHQLCCSRGFA